MGDQLFAIGVPALRLMGVNSNAYFPLREIGVTGNGVEGELNGENALCVVAEAFHCTAHQAASSFGGDAQVFAYFAEALALAIEKTKAGFHCITGAIVEGAKKLIQQFGRAYDNIDVAEARRCGVSVANLVRLSSLSSADHITCLILALARRLLPAHAASRARRNPSSAPAWSDDPPRNKFNWAGVKGFKILAHSTIGFIGLGENSGYVAKRLRDMGMRVLYFKRNPLSRDDEAALGGVEYRPLDDLLAQSDFVSLHLPYSPATEKFANGAFFERMKAGAYFINSARGGLVDERALYDALSSGRLAGAALDVYRYEPLPENAPLLDLDSVLWTPHMSGGEPEFMIEEARDVLKNIARVHKGEKPVGLV